MNVILFGPPGVGKSTIIQHLKLPAYGLIALDIELVWNDKPAKGRAKVFMDLFAQVQRVFKLQPMVVGGAGLDITIKYPGYKKVLLLLKQSEYETRRDVRNAERPEFAKQGEHSMEDWLKATTWDYVVSASGDITDVVKRIVGITNRIN